MMMLSSIFIVISYVYMRKAFFDSVNLQGSHYKDSLQNGFLVIAVAYVIRAIYSLGLVFWTNLFKQSFWALAVQIVVNLLMDLPSILVVLAINRNTIKLRTLLNNEREKRKNEQT